MNGARRIAAVVVTYHASAEMLARLLHAVRPQVQGIVIVDNTPAQAASVARALEADDSSAVIHNQRNLGLATAQNQGIQWAAAAGFTHVFMLDQDSIPEPGCVDTLYDAAGELRRRGVAAGAVGPRVLDRRTGRAYSFKRFTFAGIRHGRCEAGAEVIPADFVIASGSLMSIESLQAIGPMDDGLFIDRIDIDWCLRAAAMGQPVFGVCAARLQHEPGEHSRPIWIGRRTEVAVHSPERTYYMIRNSFVLYRRPYAPLRWIIHDAVWLLGVAVISCVIAPGRMRRLALVLKGARDGLRGVQGPLQDSNPCRE